MTSFQFSCHGETGSTGKRIASKGAGVVAGFKNVGLLVYQQGTDGMATAEAFRQGDRVRGDPKLLITPKLTATAHAHLHFVEDQQDLSLAAMAPDRLKNGWIAGNDSPFPLKRFDQDSRHPWAIGFRTGK